MPVIQAITTVVLFAFACLAVAGGLALGLVALNRLEPATIRLTHAPSTRRPPRRT